MPRPSMSVTTEVTQKAEIKLAPRLQAKLDALLKETEALGARISKDKARQDTIKSEVEKLFEDAGEFGALLEGVKVNGFSVKYVTGNKDTLDKTRLMRNHGLTQADLDACTDTKPSKPYTLITPPKTKGDK